MTEEKTIKKLKQEFSDLKKDKTPHDKHFDAVVVLCAEGIEIEGENKERIDAAIEILNNTKDQTPLIFLGTIKHIKNLELYAQKKHFSDILIVSSAYHIPRVKRYCMKYIKGINCSFLPAGDIEAQSHKIEGEIDRIIRYSKKGDLLINI